MMIYKQNCTYIRDLLFITYSSNICLLSGYDTNTDIDITYATATK